MALPGAKFPNNGKASAFARSRLENTYLLPFARHFPGLFLALQSFTHSVDVHRHLGGHEFPFFLTEF